MRGTRWLLLVAITAIIFGVGLTYRAQKRALREHSPARPAALPDDLNSTSQDWCFTVTATTYTKVEVCARDAKEVRDSSRVDLKGVTMKLHNKNGLAFDLIKSAEASVFRDERRFYSEGEVEITLNVPEQGESTHPLVSVKSSGVNFNIDTGRAETDRPANFIFEAGTGQSVGAFYDPSEHRLVMKQDVKLDLKPAGPRAKPMKIEAGSLEYREDTNEIWLRPWGRLTRENTVVEGENAVVHLQEDDAGHKSIGHIEALKAHGTDSYPQRKLQYSADELWVHFNRDGAVEKIVAQTNAHLVATSESAETTVSAYHVEMAFDAEDQESTLTNVSANGSGVVTSKPLPAPGRQLAETHVLRSDMIEMKMRPGGREIDNVTTHAPGTLEFLPNAPTQHHRLLNARQMVIAYAAQNRIQSFRGTEVRTQTDPTPEEAKRKRPVSITTSRDIQASFDPKTSRMTSIEQSGDFAYEEGDRRARAAKATLDASQNQNLMLLDTGARVWDATGSTSADHIRLDQRTDDFTAEGNVHSTRLPDKDQKKSSEMLAGDEPIQAQARKMVSTNRNRSIHYEGDVLLVQGANRIQANAVDLDREKRMLVADGNVVTNLWEEPKDQQKKKAANPVLTEVRSSHLVYTEAGRLAHYTGGAILKRPLLEVKAAEIKAYLAESGADSRLEKAFAHGSVQILQTSPDRTRTGTAEDSEYYTGEQKVVLLGGTPKFVDSKEGTTIGPLGLTYFINDGRLLVKGGGGQPAQSRVKGKK